MRALFSAIALVSVFGGMALAEPMKLDEAMLEDVAAGVGIEIVIAVPTSIENNVEVSNQIGNVFAINTNAVIAALSSNVSGTGNATGGFMGSISPMP